MLKPFNSKGWKRWNKAKMAEGEIAEYLAIQNPQNDRIVLFRSADEMIANFKKNHVAYGGKAWTQTEHMANDDTSRDNWRFGDEFDTRKKTNHALEVGEAAEKYAELRESITAELFDQFPELYELTAKATEMRSRRGFSNDGDELDMDRFFGGQEDAFSKKKKRETTVLAARFYIDICVSGGTSTEVLSKNLIYSLVMAEIVQKSGIAVEIITGATSNGATTDARLYNVSVVAKHHDEPFDISRILSMALPGVFREYCFGVWSNITDTRADSGLGRVCTTDKQLQPIFDFFDGEVSIRGGDAVMKHDQLRVIIDKVAKILNMTIEGSGYADGDGEHCSGGMSWGAMNDDDFETRYTSERQQNEKAADDEAEKDDIEEDDWFKNAMKGAFDGKDDDETEDWDKDDDKKDDDDNW